MSGEPLRVAPDRLLEVPCGPVSPPRPPSGGGVAFGAVRGLLFGAFAASVAAAMVAGTTLAAPGPSGVTLPAPIEQPIARSRCTTAERERIEQRLRKLDALLRRAQRAGFRGTVLVARDGEVLFTRGYGYANSTTRTPNAPSTRFDIGSVTKQFVAAAILHLEDRGLLSLDDPISKYFDVPGERGRITLAQLLSHRSGLRYPDDEGSDSEVDPPPRQMFEEYLRSAPRVGDPGERFYYNSVAYNVLAYVIEQVSGERFEDYLTRHLFGPAGMTNTGFNEPGSVPERDAAIGYENRRRMERAGELPNGWGFRGATGVVSDVRDLLRWTEALRGGRLLSPRATAKLFTPPPGPVPRDEDPYALGWVVELGADGRPVRASHDGLTMGFVSRLVFDLGGGYTIITLSNDFELGSPFLDTAERVLSGADCR